MLERFIADCRAARAADATHKAVREVVARAVSQPGAVLAALGEQRYDAAKTMRYFEEENARSRSTT